jgi:hypothetical protein
VLITTLIINDLTLSTITLRELSKDLHTIPVCILNVFRMSHDYSI